MEKAKTLFKVWERGRRGKTLYFLRQLLVPRALPGKEEEEGGREGAPRAPPPHVKERKREREREAKTVSKREGEKVLSCSWPAVGRYPPTEVQGSFLKAHRRRKEDPKTHTHYSRNREREPERR